MIYQQISLNNSDISFTYGFGDVSSRNLIYQRYIYTRRLYYIDISKPYLTYEISKNYYGMMLGTSQCTRYINNFDISED